MKSENMLAETRNTFNGSYNADYTNDPIHYCPYCGKKIDLESDAHYCKFCGKAIPRTYTGSMYTIHWNLPTGEPTYPIKEERHC